MARRVTSRDFTNACALLGITASTTADEAKQAFRDLAKVWHPDRFESDPRLKVRASEKLKQLNAAHAIVQQALAQGVDVIHSQPEPPKQSKARTLLALVALGAAGLVVFVTMLHFGWSFLLRVRQEPAAVVITQQKTIDAPASQPASLPASMAASVPTPKRKVRTLKEITAPSLLEVYALVLKNASAHVGDLACGDGFIFNAEEKNGVSTFQIWLKKGKRILFEKNVFFTMQGTAKKCVQDISVKLCARAAGSKTYKTRQGETQTVPYFNVDAIVCGGELYQ